MRFIGEKVAAKLLNCLINGTKNGTGKNLCTFFCICFYSIHFVVFCHYNYLL